MSGAEACMPDMRNSRNGSFVPVVVFSIVFHVIVLLIVPLTVHMFWKPKEYSRPKTFQLVRPAIPQSAPKPPAPEVKKQVEPAPQPKAEPKPQPKPKPSPTPKPADKPKPVDKPAPEPNFSLYPNPNRYRFSLSR
ncbi:MAG: hypothetical protein ACOC41_07550, partial [Chitinivibrionales bacterium]